MVVTPHVAGEGSDVLQKKTELKSRALLSFNACSVSKAFQRAKLSLSLHSLSMFFFHPSDLVNVCRGVGRRSLKIALGAGSGLELLAGRHSILKKGKQGNQPGGGILKELG